MGLNMDETKSDVFKKAEIAKRKAKVMERMKKKRNEVIKNISDNQEVVETNPTESHKCTLCYEDCEPSQFTTDPYGYIGLIVSKYILI